MLKNCYAGNRFTASGCINRLTGYEDDSGTAHKPGKPEYVVKDLLISYFGLVKCSLDGFNQKLLGILFIFIDIQLFNRNAIV